MEITIFLMGTFILSPCSMANCSKVNSQRVYQPYPDSIHRISIDYPYTNHILTLYFDITIRYRKPWNSAISFGIWTLSTRWPPSCSRARAGGPRHAPRLADLTATLEEGLVRTQSWWISTSLRDIHTEHVHHFVRWFSQKPSFSDRGFPS